MDWQNLAYTVTQVAHNFGAVAVTGGAVCALAPGAAEVRRKLAWLVLVGWAVQATSGATFGAISFYYYHQFPDIHGIAIAALFFKMACAVFGLLLAAWYLRAKWNVAARRRAWLALCDLAFCALTAAAILRWFS